MGGDLGDWEFFGPILIGLVGFAGLMSYVWWLH